MQLQGVRAPQASITNSPSSLHIYFKSEILDHMDRPCPKHTLPHGIYVAHRAHADLKVQMNRCISSSSCAFCGRNHGAGAIPDPFPNSEVKPRIADGTAAQGRGRAGRSAHRGHRR